MKPFHKQLQDRLEATGDFRQPMWHFMADVLEHTATEADRWTHRADDARRIPDMIDEAVRWCREEAEKHEVADPVVVRLEAEVERLSGDYAKLYGVVREYIACEKHPQMRGEAYRDLRSTYDLLSGADADQGWPACYQRILKQLDDANADNTRMRGLLREAVEAADYRDSDDEWWGNMIDDSWFVRVVAALEGKP